MTKVTRLGEILTCKSGKRAKLTLAAYFSYMNTTVYCSYYSVAAQLIRLATHPQT